MGKSELDDAMDILEGWESRQGSSQDRQAQSSVASSGKTQIGNVEQFFSKINVVAVKLTGDLSIGDIIEIGNEEEAIRQKVTSMQINGTNIDKASEGDDVGIKLKYPVSAGSSIYKVQR
jgi:putative protease